MKFYIIDDDIAIIKILKNIIENLFLDAVVDYSEDAEEGIKDIVLTKPDVVLIDLLMPKKDGIEIVKEIKGNDNNIKFIMISQVSSKSMISKAYTAGIEFFINKPINRIEVTNVMKKIIEKIRIEEKLNDIKKSMLEIFEYNAVSKEEDKSQKIKTTLNELGIMGERGGKDIINICNYLIDRNERSLNFSIKKICQMLSENPRAMEQRIRRAINKALVNIANLGIEDYMNDTFINYSNSLFDFKDVKAEMDFIRQKREKGGKISVKKFIDGLLIQSEL